jgi:2,3,4,5-tetrahydropyridine-2-carboxylate N-succinyltransferase
VFAELEKLYDNKPDAYTQSHKDLFVEFLKQLDAGIIRSAEPDATTPSGWKVNGWVKKGILVGFRMGEVVEFGKTNAGQGFFDKATYPLRPMTVNDGVRVVPGGSSIREGCFIGRGVTCMPPMYINVGAYVGDGTMVDSHALIGSCAQVGSNCHISAAAQIGGVLEPVGALPCIIEDGVLVGGNCGVYEGTVVKKRAVLGSGTILNGSTPVYDLVRGVVHRSEGGQPLIIPEDAVVVAGSRAIGSGIGKEWGISLYTPVIVKYRDEKTDAKVQLEDVLR